MSNEMGLRSNKNLIAIAISFGGVVVRIGHQPGSRADCIGYSQSIGGHDTTLLL